MQGQNKGKKYILPMLPYPSGNIHMGHARNYTISDVLSRYYKMRGFDVMHPIGWDSFGLPAENAAIEHGLHPKNWTVDNISSMKYQLNFMNIDFNWDKELSTHSKEYFQHQQNIFIALYNKGYIYKKYSWVNWDPIDKTVLANEQVINGKCWRSGADVKLKKMNQWFFNMKRLAPDLLKSLDNLNQWPSNVKNMQKEWIGEHEMYASCAKVIKKSNDKENEIGTLHFSTTMPHTIFGTHFFAISINNDLTEKCFTDDQISSIINADPKEKVGAMSDIAKVIHPITNEQLPLYIANYVIDNIGEGAIMGCPAHDQRDMEFAQKYNIVNNNEFIKVIDDNIIINCPDNWMDINGKSDEYFKEILISKGIFKKKKYYKLKDWCLSRQRYWGAVIPIIYCDKCGILTNPNIPVESCDEYNGPNTLKENLQWQQTKCHKCGCNAIKDTDTMDTFVDSSWYFLRYCDKLSPQDIPEKANYWMPVDVYIGGIEHATGHLIYARAMTKALKSMGMIDVSEPFVKLVTQGMICMESYKNEDNKWVSPNDIIQKDGMLFDINGKKVFAQGVEKMSKSKKNTIHISDIVNKYNSDVVRWFMVSCPVSHDIEWSENGLSGGERFINKIKSLVPGVDNNECDYTHWIDLYNTFNNEIIEMNFNLILSSMYKMLNYLKTLPDGHKHIHPGMYLLAHCMNPFMPQTSSEVIDMLGNINNQSGSINMDKIDKVANYILNSKNNIINFKLLAKGKFIDNIKINSNNQLSQEYVANEISKWIVGDVIAKDVISNDKKQKILKILNIDNIDNIDIFVNIKTNTAIIR